MFVVVKAPNLSQGVLASKLSKGMKHNFYGEPAWPNDILYIFPVCILGLVSFSLGLPMLDPPGNDEPENPFVTPEEIFPDWYFLSTFELLRTLPNKLAGVVSMIILPVFVLFLPFVENVNPSQNPFRRPHSSSLHLFSFSFSFWSCFTSLQPLV